MLFWSSRVLWRGLFCHFKSSQSVFMFFATIWCFFYNSSSPSVVLCASPFLFDQSFLGEQLKMEACNAKQRYNDKWCTAKFVTNGIDWFNIHFVIGALIVSCFRIIDWRFCNCRPVLRPWGSIWLRRTEDRSEDERAIQCTMVALCCSLQGFWVWCCN